MLIKELMMDEVKMIDADDTVMSAARIMAEQNIGALPVRDNDRLIGMLTDRDIITRVIADGRRPEDTRARDAMTAGMKYCYEDEESNSICDNMRNIGVRRLTVMTRDKKLVGIVSMSDIEEPAGSDVA